MRRSTASWAEHLNSSVEENAHFMLDLEEVCERLKDPRRGFFELQLPD